ncbi:MAG TPA: FemAB family PEP-CTERM system-associated protein [Phycisphaerae bacterium]|nr:FemAB family PEP-CTERM system-associated protein [Phycisphaerae bacterium]HOB72991.1 FemAB family PEP-CTERM system-associated protein [Phycisphaerae bacterium]HOJ52960.1 FemAB family PEP-CTERM system-associated protein [Phycisphaerae bacterium]HOL24697.1 FemAB family PEP-CTERM system-associated protein [Phycisphaerae bacterium]HPP19233.1 FemAB family PEP-CTERM system-associated protein [Phycisphaerae bacterium]
MAVDVMELKTAQEGFWEAYVARHPRATFFHTLAWRDAVEAAFGHRSHYLLASRNGLLTGVFPLMCVHSHLAGTILVSVPYAVYGGCLFDDEESRDALLRRAEILADYLGARWLDIRSAEALHPGLPVVDRYVTFRKPLPATPSEVLNLLPRKARAAARQARERYGLRVEFGDRHLETVWRLYSQSMRRLASPNYPLAFFNKLIERTAEAQAHLVQLIWYQDQPVAGLVSFIYRGTLMPYFVGCDERFEKYHPNNFLYLTAMERGVELGCHTFDFGRSRVDNTGSYDFKRNQGFEPTPLGYQYYVPEGGTAPDLYPTSPKVRLARRIWPRLPLAVTRPLGAWLAKSIPG